jgi:hypothetical protein
MMNASMSNSDMATSQEQKMPRELCAGQSEDEARHDCRAATAASRGWSRQGFRRSLELRRTGFKFIANCRFCSLWVTSMRLRWIGALLGKRLTT